MSSYAGKTVATLVANTLARLRQPVNTFDRYSRDNILSALNDANMEVALRKKCLHSFAVIVLKNGYSQYAPPTQLITPKCAFFYQSSSSYYELKLKDRAYLDETYPGWRVTNGDPTHMYPGDSFGSLRKLGFYPTPNADGDDYTTSPDTGIVISATGLTVTGNITGNNNAAHATICTDAAARTLSSLGVEVGMIALNITDGSQGQISAVSGSTFTVTLTGGTNNQWAVGDDFTILAGEYGVVTGITGTTEQYIFSSEYGEMVDIESITGNVYLEFYRRPLELVYDTQYSEIPIELHQYLPDYATWILKRDAPRGSMDFMEASAALQAFDRVIPPVSYVSIDDAVKDNRIRFNW